MIIGFLFIKSYNWSLSYQDMVSFLGEQLGFFHDNIMFIVIIITFFVGWLMYSIIKNNLYYKYLIHGERLEIIWTVLPALILLFIAFPSLHLLYLLDEVIEPIFTIKASGHQWYWSYEFSDIEENTIEFDSFMIPFEELNVGDFRLLEADKTVTIPLNTNIRVVVTGADVIHSFAVPSLGIKVDAVPGRLNQLHFFAKRPGVFYGQCSEICGTDHSFMPIVITIGSKENFINFIKNQYEAL
uniref:cytochrome c oxidase subunit II n=1 Tax=Craseoa lathetica TaxID=316205 RepID=UPI0026E237BE|nr:cytochrome c oxidase subunit II [Craseoa lathetica]WJJ70136.1 cytochrome c oxidase subunit 2 [Craseoa lathetica]